jgi:hypothetical protein
VLAVSQDMGGRGQVDAFFEERQVPDAWSPISIPELALMTGLMVDTLPTTILYDAFGREGGDDGNGEWQASAPPL